MSCACVELGTYLGLNGQWGVDFAIDGRGTPIMVDLNMGRPNGSLSYYCWRARQTDPKGDTTAGGAQRKLALAASTFCPPVGLRLSDLAASLKASGLLWSSQHGSGVVLAQFLPGVAGGGTVLAASWEGTHEACRILNAFKEICPVDLQLAGLA